MHRVVVVGASLAGLRAVEALRAKGFDGEITLIGSEDRPPYDRPPLSKGVLAGTFDLDRLPLRSADVLEGLQVDFRLGEPATGLDLATRQVRLAGGDRVGFDGLVITTGASPRELPGTEGMAGVHTLRTFDDAMAIKAALDTGTRLVVIGAGFIGAEVAATARMRGLDVTVLEALPVPVARGLGTEMGAACAALHLDHGTDLRLGVTVDGLVGDGRVEGVRLRGGDVVPADAVLVGIGVVPNTAWLEGSGLVVDNGVVCDQTCAAVGAEGVYAAGDVARWHNPLFGEDMRVEHWTNATEQGGAAARNLLAWSAGEAGEPFGPVPYFWSDQYGTKIQYVGHGRDGDEVRVVHGSVDDRRFTALYGRDGRLVAALSFAMPARLMRYQRLLADGATFDEALDTAAELEAS